MFRITIPFSYSAERAYIISVIFNDFLGLEFEILQQKREDYLIECVECSGRITLPDSFFPENSEIWLKPRTLPKRPLNILNIYNYLNEADVLEERIPVIYGDNPESGSFLRLGAEHISLGLDIFGSAFFMLSRYEELVNGKLDEHYRFCAESSLAYEEGFIERPIIDEYVEILWLCIKKLWPAAGRRKKNGRVFITCDVDIPYEDWKKDIIRGARAVIGDITKRQSMAAAIQRIKTLVLAQQGLFPEDANNTFEWFIEECEKAGHRAAFFFICGGTHPKDPQYKLGELFIKRLMKRIHEREHEIGVHGSYDSFNNSYQIVKEFHRLRSICEELGIRQNSFGNRQHYLRWDSSLTPSLLERAGASYDTTLGYHDHTGFRTGTCNDYPMWDFNTRSKLSVRERPLIMMECTVFFNRYMGLEFSETTLKRMLNLKSICMKYGGEFVVLWHNSQFKKPEERDFFSELIR